MHDAHSERSGVRVTLHRRNSSASIPWQSLGDLDWSRFGLVLGAGGGTGAAFESGALLALAVDHGHEPGDASLIVGTSAGSIGAALVARGFDASSIAAVVSGAQHHLTQELSAVGVTFMPEVPAMPALWRLVAPPSFRATTRWVRHVLQRQVAAAAVTPLRPGWVTLDEHLSFLEDAEWPSPAGRLRIVALDQWRCKRAVFTGPDPSLAKAVAASCAIPGLMRPVDIDGRPHVDGGVLSPTNADLLRHDNVSLVVVLSPMSGDTADTALGRMSARHARRELAREIAILRQRVPVLVMEPSGALSRTVVDDATGDADHVGILSSSFVGSSADDE